MLDTLTWRPLTGADRTALAALYRQILATDGGMPDAASSAFLGRRYFVDEVTTSAWSGAELVGAAGLRTGRDADLFGTAVVAPARRGQGLGGRLLNWLIAESAGRPLQVETESLTTAAAELFQSRGLHHVFGEDVLRIGLPMAAQVPPLPAGVALVAWTPAVAQRFFATYQESFRHRPGFPNWSAERWIDSISGDDDFAPEWTFLATMDGADRGFVACAHGSSDVEAADPWLVQLGVVPAARRSGLGAALAGAALSRMATDGATGAVLDVNVNNPGALRLYERLGFARIGRRARYRRPTE